VQVAMPGPEPDRSTALSYLRTLAQRQVKAGARFLDVNVDEVSTKLDYQLEAMRWLVRELAPLDNVRLSIDSSNLEIISAGITEASQAAGTRVGPPTGLRRDFRVIPGRWQRGEKVFPLRVK